MRKAICIGVLGVALGGCQTIGQLVKAAEGIVGIWGGVAQDAYQAYETTKKTLFETPPAAPTEVPKP